jgi:hypothetical protein
MGMDVFYGGSGHVGSLRIFGGGCGLDSLGVNSDAPKIRGINWCRQKLAGGGNPELAAYNAANVRR